MRRRKFLERAGVGVAGLSALAGCAGDDGDGTTSTTTGTGGGNGTATTTGTDTTTEETTGTTTGTAGETADVLRVGTYPAFLDAPSISAGGYVKEQFESEYDVTLKWSAQEQGLNYYIQRKRQGVDLDVDAYYGLTPTDLVRSDAKLDADLFRSLDRSAIANTENVPEAFWFAPRNRAVPSGASYVCIVYDERDVPAPTSFDDLTGEEYSDGLLVPSPQGGQTGLDFMYWTIEQFGEDGYLDYWERLTNNGARVLGGWSDAYAAYSSDEAPMVVSFSTDQVYAAQSDTPMAKHQVAFLENEGYAYVEGTGVFSDTDRTQLAETFLDFLLQPEIQAGIAKNNVGMPVVSNAQLPTEFAELAYRPENPVAFGYDRLQGNIDRWVNDWARRIAGQ